jgi:hypothetical protein
MPIRGVDYKLLVEVAREAQGQPEKLQRLGIEPGQVDGLIEVLQVATRGQESYFLGNADHVAQAYRILETAGRARLGDNSDIRNILLVVGEALLQPTERRTRDTSERDRTILRVARANLTLEVLRDLAAKSAWARRAAGSSGIFGVPKAFLKVLRDRISDIDLLDEISGPKSRLAMLTRITNRSNMMYAGLMEFLQEDPHAFSLLAHKGHAPEYQLDSYTQGTLEKWEVFDTGGEVSQFIAATIENELPTLQANNSSIITDEKQLKWTILLRELLYESPEAFYALMERYRDSDYRLDAGQEAILRARGVPMDSQDPNYETMRGFILRPIHFDVFDALCLRRTGQFILPGIGSLSQTAGTPVADMKTSFIVSKGPSQRQAREEVLARRLEQMIRRDVPKDGPHPFIRLVLAFQAGEDLTPSDVFDFLALPDPPTEDRLSASATQISSFFQSPSKKRAALYALYQELHGVHVRIQVAELTRQAEERRSFIASTISKLFLAMQQFQHDPSQGNKFVEAVTEFIAVKTNRRPSPEDLALYLTRGSERSMLNDMSLLMQIKGGSPGDFEEAIGRAREAGLFGEGEAASKAEREKDRRPGRPRRPKK